MSDLTRLEAATAGLESLPELEETADYVGRLDAVIRSLQGHRKMVMSEVSGPVAGHDYRIVVGRESKRSYNDRRLLDVFARSGHNFADLVDRDVLRLSWQWTKMRNLAITEDIGLRIACDEIDPEGGEADHVGEVWRDVYKVEGVQ